MPNFYFKEVEARIKDGTAVVQDYLYQDEILRRKRDNDNSAVGDDKKITFLKLTDRQIMLLVDKYGEGEEKFIEKLKTMSGNNAGKVDLFFEEQTGDIFIKPINNPNAPGG
ncbi:hypothetical protein COR50_14080 [Chitinophaga caeni]|uniref:Uncharacterized protein n=1 Tax=Chitinophaga caeni TaxID=2029983 RepID=A0A291QVY7_9BACT|nr:hypothetical protein [Chitinophaga caeni]ATL48199.1 hypothetical protein COR50_14080 [Chitinophaga caeni]